MLESEREMDEMINNIITIFTELMLDKEVDRQRKRGRGKKDADGTVSSCLHPADPKQLTHHHHHHHHHRRSFGGPEKWYVW